MQVRSDVRAGAQLMRDACVVDRTLDCYANQASRESLEGDPENGSRLDADSAVLDGADRRSRFDLKEGHDLERLLWPRNG